jgi:protein TonB
MFADSLLDVSWRDRSRRGYATLISFTLEALAVGALITAPFLYVQGLPRAQWMATLSVPAPPPAPLPASAHIRHTQVVSEVAADGHIIMPTRIPEHAAQINDESVPPPADVAQLGVRSGLGDSIGGNAFLNSAGTGPFNVAPPPSVVVPKPVRISHLMDGYLIYRLQPEYPPIARQARIQGSVVLHALIGRDGRIEKLQALSGPVMLVQSAINAVSQWRYRPYVLNNEPVEVETQITVNFTLAGG